MSNLKKILFLIAALFTFCISAQQKYPRLTEIVTDSARIFTPNQLKELKTKLSDFETETSNQLVVLTIRELGHETIETYANGTFNQNGLGQKEKDNGILILFSSMDREVRIEVGYGLEPYITDAVASRVIINTMIPNFKEERYFEGINTAVDELILYMTNPEVLEEFKAEIAASKQKNKIIGIVFLIGFLSFFMGVGGFFFYKSYRNLIEVFRGIFMGKICVLSGLFLIPLTSITIFFGLLFMIVPLIVSSTFFKFNLKNYSYLLDKPSNLFWGLVPFFGIAIIIALIKIHFFGKEDLKISWIKNNKNYMRKTFSSSGSHSFGSSSSGGSSGGFSGGGGSSGGGGASGSW